MRAEMIFTRSNGMTLRYGGTLDLDGTSENEEMASLLQMLSRRIEMLEEESTRYLGGITILPWEDD